MTEPTWDVWERAAFLRLLRAGAGAIPVFEALDHEGVLVRLLPEWEHVRSRPQRNAYHRFTVDRHLLEAVAQCAALLDAGETPRRRDSTASSPARAGARSSCCSARCSTTSARACPATTRRSAPTSRSACMRRIGLDSEGREIVTWLVRNHLLMADVATRRDLSDATVADNLAATCSGDAERLRLLYLLTIGDSRATGPAAWGTTKGALLRDLFVKAAAAIERGEAAAVADDRRDRAHRAARRRDAPRRCSRGFPTSYLLAFDVDEIVEHTKLLAAAPAVRFRRRRRPVSRSRSSRAGPAPACSRRSPARSRSAGSTCIEAQPLRHHRRPRARRVPSHRSVRARPRRRGERVERQLLDALDGEIDVDAPRRRARAATTSGADRERGPSAVEVDDRRVRRPTRSSRSTPTTRSACCTGSPRRSPTSASTCGSPRSRRSARASSTSSTCATRPGAKVDGSRRPRRAARRVWSTRAESIGCGAWTPTTFAVSASDLLRWSETLSGIARTGLGFTQSLYEKERFEEVLKVAADIRAAAIEEAESDVLFEEWLATVGEGVAGYVTPKVAVAAVVGNDEGEILLTQRADSGWWLYPGRLGRRRLLAVGDRDQGSARGDRHRVRSRSRSSRCSTACASASRVSRCTRSCSTAA